MSGPCCAAGELHMGTPVGYEEKLHGLDCYVSNPFEGESKATVVIISDIFGWKLPNSRILADQYAKRLGMKVLLPDFFDGFEFPSDALASHETVQKASGVIGFITNLHHWAYLIRWGVPLKLKLRNTVVNPRVFGFFKALRQAEGDKPIGTAGFCWGGKYVILVAADTEKIDGRSLIDCGFVAHPSRLKIPNDIECIQKPLSAACGGKDQGLPMEKALEIKRILEEKNAKQKNHEFVLYETAYHGFAVRGSKEDPEENRQGQEAEDQAVAWFDKWLVK